MSCTTLSEGEVPKPKHHTTKGFQNLYVANDAKSFKDMVRWKVLGDGPRGTAAEQQAVPRVPINTQAIAKPGEAPQVTWIGHSTALVQMGGYTILTDPVFQSAAPRSRLRGPSGTRKRPSTSGLCPKSILR